MCKNTLALLLLVVMATGFGCKKEDSNSQTPPTPASPAADSAPESTEPEAVPSTDKATNEATETGKTDKSQDQTPQASIPPVSSEAPVEPSPAVAQPAPVAPMIIPPAPVLTPAPAPAAAAPQAAVPAKRPKYIPLSDEDSILETVIQSGALIQLFVRMEGGALIEEIANPCQTPNSKLCIRTGGHIVGTAYSIALINGELFSARGQEAYDLDVAGAVDCSIPGYQDPDTGLEIAPRGSLEEAIRSRKINRATIAEVPSRLENSKWTRIEVKVENLGDFWCTKRKTHGPPTVGEMIQTIGDLASWYRKD